MHILEGEALMNDASGLVALKFAIAAALTGAFSLRAASISFVFIALGGLLPSVADLNARRAGMAAYMIFIRKALNDADVQPPRRALHQLPFGDQARTGNRRPPAAHVRNEFLYERLPRSPLA